MKVASAMGVSLISLNHGTQEGLAEAMSQPSDEVSYVAEMRVVRDDDGMPTGREPIYDSIPRDVWVDLEATEKVQQKITRKIQEKFPDTRGLCAYMAKMDESPTGFGVKISYEEIQLQNGEVVEPTPELSQVRKQLPSRGQATVGRNDWERRRTAIPIIVSGSNIRREQGYEHDWGSNIPGGAVVNNGTANATYFYDSEYHLTTAGHVVGETSTEWGNPTESEEEGYVRKRENNEIETEMKDYALLRDYGDRIADSTVRNDSSTNPDTDLRVYGTVSYDSIRNDYWYGNNTMTFQGSSSGRVTGLNVEEMSKNSPESQTMGVDYETSMGDSGGIYFSIDEYDQAHIMGIHSDLRTSPSTAETIGNTAECMENNFGGYFA